MRGLQGGRPNPSSMDDGPGGVFVTFTVRSRLGAFEPPEGLVNTVQGPRRGPGDGKNGLAKPIVAETCTKCEEQFSDCIIVVPSSSLEPTVYLCTARKSAVTSLSDPGREIRTLGRAAAANCTPR